MTTENTEKTAAEVYDANLDWWDVEVDDAPAYTFDDDYYSEGAAMWDFADDIDGDFILDVEFQVNRHDVELGILFDDVSDHEYELEWIQDELEDLDTAMVNTGWDIHLNQQRVEEELDHLWDAYVVMSNRMSELENAEIVLKLQK